MRCSATRLRIPTSKPRPMNSTFGRWHRRNSQHPFLTHQWPTIQESKELRTGIAKRDDVKLVFIAGERTTEGSDAYKKYVAEWLADEETVCVTNADFSRLQELFRFNGIPHYETITPDCRRVRDDLRIDGYDNFDYELTRLKERLK